ncbi:MAG: hypothetical protein PHD04_02950 [Candidatus Pacebacteria bacterium]|nr:hypothetical protein [Candidatus Paceibacterota bacterium]
MTYRFRFSCDACGTPFLSRDNGGLLCPVCGGFGIQDPRCTCPYWPKLSESPDEQSIIDPNCPVHGEAAHTADAPKRIADTD